MKSIVLLGPAVIAGAVRYPVEGPQIVPDDEADRLIEANLAVSEAEFEDGEGADDDLDAKNLTDLGLIVTKEGVPLNGATKKDDIIAKIRAHRVKA